MRFIANFACTREEAEEILLSPKDKISVDIETVSLKNTLPLGIGVGIDGSRGFYFFNPRDEILVELFRNTPIIIFHNAKFDIPLLKSLGYTINDYEDTKMLAYSAGILDNSLEDLSMSILSRSYTAVTSQWRKKNQGNIAIDHVVMGQICITHACATYALEEELTKTELYKDIDKACIPLLMEMEGWGLLIDQYRLTLVEQQVMSQALPMEKELMEEMGVDNLFSNPQVATALKKLGIIGTRKTKGNKDAVSVASLKPLDLPLTNKFLKWKSLMKTVTTYVPALREADHLGRIHTRFGYARTGRWTSSQPNLQNLTRDEKYDIDEGDVDA